MEAIAVQALQGLTFGTTLFLVAAGLSIIWGLMNILNFTHGTLYALGAYLGLVVFGLTGGNFWAALLAAFVIVAGVGAALEIVALRRLFGRDPLYYFLLTFGLTFVLTEVIRLIWGDDFLGLPAPAALEGSLQLGITFPLYRLFVIGVSLLVAIGVWLLLMRTNFGLLLRAGTQNPEMVSVLGTNIHTIYTLGFALGSGLAGLAGVLVAPLTGLSPQMGVDLLLQAFIVVIIGGLGSFRGAAVASLLVGEIYAFGIRIAPSFSMLLIYAAMILVLLIKPSGLFVEGAGREV
jgi:branched-subunit amino acid ABC-type transport system permease component